MASTTSTRLGIPPLEAGDRLTRAEFERRWEAMPQVPKAELIDGVVYMPSALRHRAHGRPHALLSGWLYSYLSATPGVDMSDNASLRLDEDNEPQPDVLLRLPQSLGGRSYVDAEDYLRGAPELIGEVAATTATYDLHQKLHVYRRHGVREYLVWRVFDEQLDWFVLREGQYVELSPDGDGFYRSRVFPGLWLDPAAMLRGDVPAVLAALQRGLDSPEHAEFVARLKEKAESAG